MSHGSKGTIRKAYPTVSLWQIIPLTDLEFFNMLLFIYVYNQTCWKALFFMIWSPKIELQRMLSWRHLPLNSSHVWKMARQLGWKVYILKDQSKILKHWHGSVGLYDIRPIVILQIYGNYFFLYIQRCKLVLSFFAWLYFSPNKHLFISKRLRPIETL